MKGRTDLDNGLHINVGSWELTQYIHGENDPGVPLGGCPARAISSLRNSVAVIPEDCKHGVLAAETVMVTSKPR